MSDARSRPHVDWRSADLRGANLQGAIFQDAKLYGAKMQGLEALQANLGGAYLEGAMLPLPSAQRIPSPSEIVRQRAGNAQHSPEGQEQGQARERDYSWGR